MGDGTIFGFASSILTVLAVAALAYTCQARRQGGGGRPGTTYNGRRPAGQCCEQELYFAHLVWCPDLVCALPSLCSLTCCRSRPPSRTPLVRTCWASRRRRWPSASCSMARLQPGATSSSGTSESSTSPHDLLLSSFLITFVCALPFYLPAALQLALLPTISACLAALIWPWRRRRRRCCCCCSCQRCTCAVLRHRRLTPAVVTPHSLCSLRHRCPTAAAIAAAPCLPLYGRTDGDTLMNLLLFPWQH